ncbi:hypothetical protein B0T26DRAFT_681989 [Lasiosphaeria miniovina]|uniref:Fungal N-terminal domain-containing protein n=1 Tax=Lasiosphaeria miniovina TaxID=1954250 RepID=A0AA39ZQS5_9PEZI|nr:uncharacterized protein B0T26DRAFT_681989 [Lasiosphaeria miniovina]KAK0701888.1 hypothetical protein B0T26DRAFT_681989 [Lasiosphaeria miniovina]
MADPLSIVTGVGGLLSLTGRTSSPLHKLYRGLKNGPELIIVLSNEVYDLSLVLDRVASAKDTLERLDPVENAVFITALSTQLEKAKDVLVKLSGLATVLAKRKRSTQRVKWTLHESKAAALKDEVRNVRVRINEITMSARIELELRTVSTNVLDSQVMTIAQEATRSIRQPIIILRVQHNQQACIPILA